MRAYFKQDQNRTLERRSTTEKAPKGAAISTYQRILELDAKRRPSNDVRLKQIPILQQHNQQKLDFSHNLIRRMENLQLMKKLKILNLSHNRITTVQGIFVLRKLQEVNLSHNCIETLPKEFSWLKTIQALYLHNNKISSLECLDSISCLRLARLTLENNYVCRAAGFKKYIQLHFRWLEVFDRRPVSHREHRDQYETPLESINNEDDEGDMRTCQRNTEGIARDHTATQKRQQHKRDQILSVSSKPEATEQKILVKTERITKDTDILPYRQYLRRLNARQKQTEISTPTPVENKTQPQQPIVTNIAYQQFKPLQVQYQTLLKTNEKFIQSLKPSKSRMEQKLRQFILKLSWFFDSVAKQQINQSLSNKILKELSLVNLEMLNIESEDTIGAQLRHRIQEYVDIYCRAHRVHLSLGNKQRSPSVQAQFSTTPNPVQSDWSSNIESPTRQQKQALNKILFSGSGAEPSSNREQSSADRHSPLLDNLNAQQQKNAALQQQLAELQAKYESLASVHEDQRQQHLQYQQLMEEQLSLLTTEKNTYKQKLETVEIFSQTNRKLYEDLLKNQQQILAIMNEKLSGAFFQQIIVGQAKSIEELVRKNGEIEKYANQLNPGADSSARGGKDHGLLSKTRNTRNTRYPDSTKVVNSAESNLLDYSDRQRQEQKNVSEFTIAESAKFPEFFKIRESVSFENIGNRQPTEYFRKSSGFSFKKSHKSLLSGSKSKGRHLITEKDQSDNKKGTQLSRGKRIPTIESENTIPHQRSYFTQTSRANITQKSSSYSQIPLTQTENYRNYLKYYLRNNIVQVLSKGQVHPHLRGRWSKEQILHRKYHSVGGNGGLITKKESSTNKKVQKQADGLA